jgi:hypothetical protein
VQKNRLRQAEREVISCRVTLKNVVSKDQDLLKKRIILFLPDLLSFDLLVNIKQ